MVMRLANAVRPFLADWLGMITHPYPRCDAHQHIEGPFGKQSIAIPRLINQSNRAGFYGQDAFARQLMHRRHQLAFRRKGDFRHARELFFQDRFFEVATEGPR